jgi:hypothetical protein
MRGMPILARPDEVKGDSRWICAHEIFVTKERQRALTVA